MDLSVLDTKKLSEEGVVMVVNDPRVDGDEPLLDDQGNGVTITLSGQDGSKYREHTHRINNRRYKAIGKGKTSVDLDSEEMEREGLDLLAACTLSWTNVGGKEGPIPCTPANAKALYESLPAVREQVDRFIVNRRNFFPKPESSSLSTTGPL